MSLTNNMMTELFKNGNKRIARFAIWKLGWGTVVIFLINVQGMLPQLDEYIPDKTQALLAFGIALILNASKSAEMFFDKTISMFKNHEIPDNIEDTQHIIKNEIANKTVS